MAKKVTAYIKLQVPAGSANPSPPVGPALGQHGLNIMEVGQFQSPLVAGNGGRARGIPRRPSIEAMSAVSSPHTNAPAPSFSLT